MIMPKSPRRILGIDPGFGRVGVGIIEEMGREWQVVYYDCIKTNPRHKFLERLIEINKALQTIIIKYKPTEAAVEELFFAKNVTTAIQVGQARGVILLTLAQAKLPVREFTPLEVKQAITGYGRAEKGQIQRMVRVLLNLKTKTVQDDAADALAVALTAAAHRGVQSPFKGYTFPSN